MGLNSTNTFQVSADTIQWQYGFLAVRTHTHTDHVLVLRDREIKSRKTMCLVCVRVRAADLSEVRYLFVFTAFAGFIDSHTYQIGCLLFWHICTRGSDYL